MATNRNGDYIPQSYCSCGARPSGNGGHAAHRKMHQRRGDGHRPVTRDLYVLCMADEALRRDCECGAGDQTGIRHRSEPPCPAYARYRATDRCATELPGNGTKWRNTADGVLQAVDKGDPIKPETLEHLLMLLREKTDYPHHVAVEVTQGAFLRTIDNENDAQETIRRLDDAQRKAKESA